MSITKAYFWIHSVIAGTLLGAAGCATPKPALRLATDTGARVSQVAGRLAEFVEAKAILAELRTENMASTLSQYETIGYAQARRMEAMELAGEGDRLALYKQLVARSEALARMKGAAGAAAERHRNLMRTSQAELQGPLKELNAVSQSLASLGKEMGFKAWIEHYARYAQQVSEMVKEKQKKIEEAKKQAEEMNQELQKPTE